MKINIEYNIVGDGRKFLNHWDSVYGEDIVCEIINDKLILIIHDDEGNILPGREISISEFLSLIEQTKYIGNKLK